MLSEQDDLEHARVQAVLETVLQIARKVTQKVHVEDMINFGAGVQPHGKDKIFSA